jgi:hypothetical protein
VSEEERVRSLLRVVRGEPSAEELAALVAVVSARASSASGSADAAPRRSAWGDPARGVRQPVSPGRDGWRASARPR